MTLDEDWVVIPTHIEEPQVYGCAKCRTHLCTEGNVLSKKFNTVTGRGYLVSNVVNTTSGPPESKHLMTGLHTCKDASCASCDTVVGWLYVDASSNDHKYKIGNWVLERAKLVELDWDKHDS